VSALPTLAALTPIDRLIHEPARLMILTILASVSSAEFRYLENLTGLSKGNLSSHMSKLEEVGLIAIDKAFRGKIPLTTLRITAIGMSALETYRVRMAQVVAGVPRLHP